MLYIFKSHNLNVLRKILTKRGNASPSESKLNVINDSSVHTLITILFMTNELRLKHKSSYYSAFC